MALLTWRDEFQIGVPEVDHEHRELIGLINQLHESAAHRGDPADSRAFLGELYAQIAAHFALEEKIMRARHYADYAHHKQDHERLLDEIREIAENCEQPGGCDPRILGEKLDLWFSVHFRTHDARLHRAL